jgi:Xaa-Pro aminopeptidase
MEILPRSELERRWALVRAQLAAENLDAMVALSADDYQGGYVKWFTDVPAFLYPKAVVFYRDAPMSVVDHGPIGGARTLDGKSAEYPGVGELFTTAEFPAISFTRRYIADLVATALKQHLCRRVGLIGSEAMPQGFVTGLKEIADGVEFSDATEAIDRAKAVKSEAELVIIRATASMQDAVFAKLLAKIRPGMRQSEVTALARYEGNLMGSEQGVFMCRSAPAGQPVSAARGPHFDARVLGSGDYLQILIENNGVGGFYTELGRTIVLGKVPSALADGFATARAAQDHTGRMLAPGATGRSVYEAHAEYMSGKGLLPSRRVYAHGQGYDLVERPLIREDEPMALAPGMCFAVHPVASAGGYAAFICDNCVIGADGAADWIHRTPKRVFEAGETL